MLAVWGKMSERGKVVDSLPIIINGTLNKTETVAKQYIIFSSMTFQVNGLLRCHTATLLL